jgi:hypothetical protein
MSRHIPGQPQIVPEVDDRAGHLLATNYLYNVAERDGSVIGPIGETVPMAHLLTPQQAKFKAASSSGSATRRSPTPPSSPGMRPACAPCTMR